MSEQRKSVFNKNNIDNATSIRNKKSTNLRKEKRSEFLTKRRMGMSVPVDQHPSSTGSSTKSIIDYQQKHQIVEAILVGINININININI